MSDIATRKRLRNFPQNELAVQNLARPRFRPFFRLFARYLRLTAVARLRDTLALSANAVPRDIETGLEAGFFNHLAKPIKVNQFMDALDVALEFSKMASGRAARKEQA